MKYPNFIISLNEALSEDIPGTHYSYYKTVYRGVNLNKEQIKVYEDIYRSDYPAFTWNSFVSTSKNKNVADMFGSNVIFEIDLEERAGYDISQFSEIKDEEEILLPINSIFEITNILNQGSKTFISLKAKNQIKGIAFSSIKKTLDDSFEYDKTRRSRIIKELSQFARHELKDISFLFNYDNLSSLKAIIKGPSKTNYEQGFYQLQVDIPYNYPFQAPTFLFETKIWHPNISSQTGLIFLNILYDEWSPALTVWTVLQSIQAILSKPNFEEPIEPLFIFKEYEQKAKEWVQKYASATVQYEKEISKGLTEFEALQKLIESNILKNL